MDLDRIMQAEGWEPSQFTINGEELPGHIINYIRMREPLSKKIYNYVDVATLNYNPTDIMGFLVRTNGWEITEQPDESHHGNLVYNHATVIPPQYDLLIRELHDQINNFEKKIKAYGWGQLE